MMQLPLSLQTVEALVQVISGAPRNSLEPSPGICHVEAKLEPFMHACGVSITVASLCGFPTLTAMIESMTE
ncbi:hypothetical protein [Aquidulcibacter paucihalophilus]|uniref:hypothetical protein n=1 Tax=Aquidulcibacter paucihalophilus TaxID=1978549 RepID=UPI000A18BCBA|nr:hypothetical protein [Aquidulcibacter paucihalophilus]